MKTLERRSFLSMISNAVAGTAISSALNFPRSTATARPYFNYPNKGEPCWLEVCAPLIIQDPTLGIDSEIVLTSDNFFGSSGYADGVDATEYQIYLYDPSGQILTESRLAHQLVVPAMKTTVLPVSEILGPKTRFWGGMKIRLKPRTRTPSHASDLFSSAFIRWKSRDSFANVHANPDPLEWQRPSPFFYSMPFPPLSEYDCVYSLFNPYADRSSGALTLYDRVGAKLTELSFDLGPHSSALVDLQSGRFVNRLDDVLERSGKKRRSAVDQYGGTVAVTNSRGSVKNFGYLLIKQANRPHFSIEHPIHQSPYQPGPGKIPFDSMRRFTAQNVLFTPLVFKAKKIAGITLDSRFHFSSGAPLENNLWLNPFITDSSGRVVWQTAGGGKLPDSINGTQQERGVIKLGPHQSCVFDCSDIDLPRGFSGGLSLAIHPTSNHTLMKVEIRVAEWKTAAFTHFRPGLAAARAYQKPLMRAGLGTDYIVSGARIGKGAQITHDEIIAIINIDDRDLTGKPFLEVFTPSGYLTRVQLGDVPPFSCKHFLLSNLLTGPIAKNDLTLRLVDDKATLLMSVLHLDYERRAFAADHGSDRFSTFNEFTCDPKSQ